MEVLTLRCINCSTEFPVYPLRSSCEKCGGTLEFIADLPELEKLKFSRQIGFWRYKQILPPVKHVVSLGEGGTPLHKAERLAKAVGLKELFLKDETRNPTNSYRDRAAAFLTSNAVDRGFETLVCATNGNMGASLAAYAARTGLICHALVPKVVDVGKLAQMIAYDAIIEESGDIVDDAIIKAADLAKETGWYQATAELNPLVVEAQKTISYEIFEQFAVPDWVIVSMGSGGTIYSLWKGFKELKQLGLASKFPRMVGVQTEGCSPIVSKLREDSALKSCNPATRALAILVADPTQSDLAIKAIKESNGLALTVSDAEILGAELLLAKLEGVFAEPASSAAVAALQKWKRSEISADSSVVCLITGSGLKATDVLQALNKKQKTAGLGLAVSTKQKILKILSEKDTYGYDLWKQLGRIMTRGAVYQHLNELADRGLVVGYEENGKKFFRLTERGKRVLAAFDDIKMLL
ncbi:MAG TPA: threonine synthase [Candidatus Limnocylindrales bacterium]|nr:threonine synthase [Candidatus Limnocylindrales bacterium]